MNPSLQLDNTLALIPFELIENHMLPHLIEPDILKLSATNKDLRSRITKILFTSVFGMVSPSEKGTENILFSETIQHLKGINDDTNPFNIAKIWTIASSCISQSYRFFTETFSGIQDSPSEELVKIVQKLNESLQPSKKDLSRLQSGMGRIASKANSLLVELFFGNLIFLKQRVKAINAMNEQPFNSLQSLRDHLIRRRTIKAELENLPRILYFIALSEISYLPFSKRCLDIGESEIVFKKEKIKVGIKAFLSEDWSLPWQQGKIEFNIERKDNGKVLGSFWCRHIWWDQKESKEATETADRRLIDIEPGQFTKHSILIPEVSGYLRDEETGDMPVIRLIVQIAVEIFKRENVERLVFLDWNEPLKDILFPRGFRPHMLEEGKNYFADVQEARRGGRKYSDKINGRRTDHLILEKSKFAYPSGKKTQFSSTDPEVKRQLTQFLIDYGQEDELQTWEEVIAERPILKGKGPVLPRFAKLDLSKYE